MSKNNLKVEDANGTFYVGQEDTFWNFVPYIPKLLPLWFWEIDEEKVEDK